MDRLILQWERFARDVKSGFWGNVYDYCHQLVMRDHLAEIIAEATPRTQSFLEKQVASTDGEFRSATIDGRPGWDLAEYSAVRMGWWWARCPRDLGKLSADFPTLAARRK